MTAAIWSIAEYPANTLTSPLQALEALKTALVLAGWTIAADTRTVSTYYAVDFSRVQNASKARGTIYMQIRARSVNFGYQFEQITSDTPDFAVSSTPKGVFPWVNDFPSTALKFLSVLHPEAAIVHIFATSPASGNSYGYVGAIRPIQKPSFIDEDSFVYAISVTGVSLSSNLSVWGDNLTGRNPYSPNDSIYPIYSLQTYSNESTYNSFTAQREIYPSIGYRTSGGWYGTTSGDLVKAAYEFPGDRLILPSGAQYLACVPHPGLAIRI